MSKATAKAFANIALVKYWGKGDEKLRLPVNSSLAIGLDQIFTVTTVEFDQKYTQDEVEIDGADFDTAEVARVSAYLNLIRTKAGITLRAKIKTKNNFPKAVGAASSASGFAALTMAATTAADLNLSIKELSILARQGSGSATRSITGGVSIWHAGISSEISFGEAVSYPKEWDLRVLLVFVGELQAKKVGSSEGMARAHTSPYFATAIKEAEANITRIQRAMNDRNWTAFGQIIEAECYRLHMLCMTSVPAILYWEDATVAIFQALYALRKNNVEAFFTIDAGPHVHIICHAKDVAKIKQKISTLPNIKNIVECGIADPAQIIQQDLF